MIPYLRHPYYLLLLMFSLFGCFKKKSAPKNINAWIEATFPDQLVVVDRNQNYDVMDLLFTGKKMAVVADKSDPDVQFTVNWSKPTKHDQGLGVDAAEVQAQLDKCRLEVQQARTLYKLLETNGLQHFSVGVIDSAAYILVFAEPDVATRRHIITAVTTTLQARSAQPQTSIWMEILEPAAFHTLFQDIVPLAHWRRPDSWHRDNKIVSLDFEWKAEIPLEALMSGWELNVNCARSNAYNEDAYEQASAWAEQHLSKPFYLESTQMIGYSLEKIPRGNENKGYMAIRFSFPYFDHKPLEPADTASVEPVETEPNGYVTGVYDIDKKTFTKIKKTAEL